MSDKNKVAASLSDNRDNIDLTHLIGAIVDNKWFVVAITALFSLIGILYSLFATPIYKADALIQVEQKIGNSLISDFSQILPSGQPESAAEIELIKSRMVLGKTVKDLGLETEVTVKYFPIFGQGFSRITGSKVPKIALSRFSVPDDLLDRKLELHVTGHKSFFISFDGEKLFDGEVGKLEEKNGINVLVSQIDADAGTVFYIRKRPLLSVINSILDNLSIADKGKNTGVLSMSLTDSDPFLAREIVDKISQNYLQKNVERKSETAARSLDFLKEQLPSVREKLDSAEDKLNNFRQLNDSVDLSLEAKSVLDTMVSVETQLNELTFKEAEISKLYTKEHPAYRTLLEKRATLEGEREKLNKRVGAMPKTQQEILRLTRDVQAGQEIYMQLLNKQQELNINKASTVGNVRIIDSAITQPFPVKPKKFVVTILVTIFGFIFSLGLIIIRALMFRGIESPAQLEAIGINVYATIPLSDWQRNQDREFSLRNKNKKENVRSNTLLAIGNPADLAIEAIRSLRTSLHFAMLESNNNILMISGASPEIGKTFVNVNLATVIAQTGLRVLIIDADMRKGYAHELMGLDLGVGLSDILSGQTSIEQSVRQTSIKNLQFLSRGKIPPNPSELLMSESFSSFIEWANKSYDITIIDTPPILAVTDAAIIGKHAGTSLLVARFGINTIRDIELSIQRFELNGTTIKGVILNAVIKKTLGYYNYAYNSYNTDSTVDSSH
ncbi:tyrosine-protein kinase Wzc [Serratia oryzae]|uniref:tyrosine-protein kinase Wzc n=1 Tax=Serratia oryzae TaxID=2034155 RepID=UPI0012E31336|nr:tyrosine-protein kinase Wzc [Serratia oryzae]